MFDLLWKRDHNFSYELFNCNKNSQSALDLIFLLDRQEFIHYLCRAIHSNQCSSRLKIEDLLGYSAKNGNLSAFKYLIGQRANVFERLPSHPFFGGTVLHIAAAADCTDIVRYLIEEQEMDKDLLDFDRTPLWYAVNSRSMHTIQYLLQKGANLENKDKDGRTLLWNAVSNDDVEMLKCLVDAGANIYAVDHEGSTEYYRCSLFYHAINRCSLNSMKYLLSIGIDVTKKTRWGQTDLMRLKERLHFFLHPEQDCSKSPDPWLKYKKNLKPQEISDQVSEIIRLAEQASVKKEASGSCVVQ